MADMQQSAGFGEVAPDLISLQIVRTVSNRLNSSKTIVGLPLISISPIIPPKIKKEVSKC